MKKFFRHTSLFTIILIVLIYGIGMFDNIDKDDVNLDMNILRLNYQQRFDSLDILFAGSSYVYSGVNPLLFDSVGLRTYNLGTSGAGPYFTELIVNNYLQSAKRKPKAIFILLAPSIFLDASDDFASYPLHKYLHPPLSNRKITSNYDLGLDGYAALVLGSFRKGFSNLFRIKSDQPGAAATSLLTHKGFFVSNEITDNAKESSEAETYAWLKKTTFSMRKADFLLKYVHGLRNKGMEIVFFEVPTNKLNSFFTPAYLASYWQIKAELGRNYIVFSNTLYPDASAFRNIDHLNANGAAIVSRDLINKINNNKWLSDLFTAK